VRKIKRVFFNNGEWWAEFYLDSIHTGGFLLCESHPELITVEQMQAFKEGTLTHL